MCALSVRGMAGLACMLGNGYCCCIDRGGWGSCCWVGWGPKNSFLPRLLHSFYSKHMALKCYTGYSQKFSDVTHARNRVQRDDLVRRCKTTKKRHKKLKTRRIAFKNNRCMRMHARMPACAHAYICM